MSRGTHPLARHLRPAPMLHYRAFMDVVRGCDVYDVYRSMDKQTGMRWRGCSKSEMAYYYATAKVPDRLGCTYPMAARCDLKKLAKDLK